MLLRWLGDLLSPPRCAACAMVLADGSRVFCPACSLTVERYAKIDRLVAFGEYGGALARAIQRFKYEQCPYLARPLGELLRQACRTRRLRADVVVPVPLHRRRLLARGYNQSALLAAHVAREVAAPIAARGLERVLETVPQAELTREARAINVEGAFSVGDPRALVGRAVALVDDVSTTGATLRACTMVLMRAGASGVTHVVLARTG